MKSQEFGINFKPLFLKQRECVNLTWVNHPESMGINNFFSLSSSLHSETSPAFITLFYREQTFTQNQISKGKELKTGTHGCARSIIQTLGEEFKNCFSNMHLIGLFVYFLLDYMSLFLLSLFYENALSFC